MATTSNRIALAPTAPSFASRITALVRDVGGLVRDHLELTALDAHRAAIGSIKALTAAVVVSILVVTAWLNFVASGIVWATDAGTSRPLALLVAGALNLLLAAGLVFWIRSQKDEFAFSATLRQVRRTAAEAMRAFRARREHAR